MKYSMTMSEFIYSEIHDHVLKDAECENAGFAFARLSLTEEETRLVIREFSPIEGADLLEAHEDRMRIDSNALARAMKHARLTDQRLVFVHSHPNGFRDFSAADDESELAMFHSVFSRNDGDGPHASLVLPRGENPFARVWLQNGNAVVMDRIRVIGKQFSFYDKTRSAHDLDVFDRQVRAFGQDLQVLLKDLTIAVVGCGGTGSAVAEQLQRLGAGTLLVYDSDSLEGSNVTRIYGSRASDDGNPKVELCKRNAEKIGLGTKVITYHSHIGDEATAKSLRAADLILGCTDDHWGRSILCEISTRYLIPFIDMGVRITSKSGIIESICGRVTTVFPGAACLICRERISSDMIRAEIDRLYNPEEAEALREEGYAPELEEKDPSVITFTTAVACTAITELIHRLTGFMDVDRESTEVIHFFDRTDIKTNAVPPEPACSCQNVDNIGIADTRDFLGMVWL
jgi:molybdopterin/thiamine biosynthesis adenylyltransferase/proteasome lid subunit RPN8/RPN11